VYFVPEERREDIDDPDFWTRPLSSVKLFLICTVAISGDIPLIDHQ
jgi:hypothetical protein